MNGYEKMKRLRRMKILKGISAATALSMTVTGLAVAASANSASSDDIANALGNLTRYGIVAESMETYSHFESNFAVKKITLNNNFDLNNAVNNAIRTIRFTVKTEEAFDGGETKEYYFGIFCDGEMVGNAICVSFTEEGTKSFVVDVPSEYKYKDLTVHQLELVATEDGKYAYATADAGTVLYAEAGDEQEMLGRFGTCVISDKLIVNNPEAFSSNKRVVVGGEIWDQLKKENDGRWFLGEPVFEQKSVSQDGIVTYENTVKIDENGNTVYQYGGAPIANSSNVFIKDEDVPMDAAKTLDDLLDNIKTASNALRSYNSGEGKVIYLEFAGSIYSDTDQSKKILECYEFLRNNPDYSMLVNVKINSGENTFNFNGGHTWDVDTASRVVYNFYGNTNPENAHITIGDGFLGTILAPDARVSNSSSFCGAVYAPKVTVGNGEPHMATYRSLNQPYSAFFADQPVITAPVVTTPEELITAPETTTPAPETTSEAATTEKTTTTESTIENSTEVFTSVPEETTVATEEVTTPTVTTPAETTPAPVATTPAETTTVTAITTTLAETTTVAPVETTPAPAENTTTTSAPIETTPVFAEVTTTTPVLVETTIVTAPPTEDTTAVPAETTLSEVEEATAAPEETTTVSTGTEPEPDPVTTTVDTAISEETPEVTTTIIIIEIDEDVPRGNLITIDEDVPLGDAPPSTGVENSVGMFIAIGCGALAIGIGAQVYSVFLKKRN